MINGARCVALASVALSIATVGVGASPAAATYSGQNGRIVFSAAAGEHTQLFTIRPNGDGLRQVTHVTDGDALHADWSPNGRWLAFAVERDDGCSIYLVHPNGRGLRDLTGSRGGCDTQPSFTPTGRLLVFERNDTADVDRMWQMGLHGRHRRPLTTIGGTDPNVSPDGRTLTFVNGKNDMATGIVAAGRYGGHLRQIVPFSADVLLKHDWAPDGSHLAYSNNSENLDVPADVVIIRPDGSHPRYLTHNRTPDQRAAMGSFSPDGRWVLYREQHGSSYALWAVSPSGTHRHLVYGPVPEDARPRLADWGPQRQ